MARTHLWWIPAVALVGWLASFVFGDLLTLPLDLYYAVYFGIVLGFFAFYVRSTELPLRAWIVRRLRWAVLLGLLGGLVLVRGVLAQAETPHLTGTTLAWAIFYRGIVYGGVDGLLLIAFPWIVVWRAYDAEHGSRGRRLTASAVALAATLLVTTTYHLGYRDFRSSKIVMPNIGSVIAAVPTLLAANPVGSIVAHAAMHVSAVVHAPETDLYLPPHRD